MGLGIGIIDFGVYVSFGWQRVGNDLSGGRGFWKNIMFLILGVELWVVLEMCGCFDLRIAFYVIVILYIVAVHGWLCS